MFSRFAGAAKSAMEETFLMITDKCIIEFKSSRLNIGSGTGKCFFSLHLTSHSSFLELTSVF